jgi:chromate transporter
MKNPLREIAGSFLKLGCIAFGGPIAHLGYFHDEYVRKRRWLDEAAYAELVALCQFLPGPASSQVVFALGLKRGGLAGACLASLCFTLPSALLMIAFACGISLAGDLSQAGWLHGLKLAAVAVVAQAVWTMGTRLCPDGARRLLALAGAAALVLLPGAGSQVAVIAAGALIGGWWYRHDPDEAVPKSLERSDRSHGWAAAALLVFAGLLIVLPLAVAATGLPRLAQFDSFYRAGSLVFGGGHVVLPLLRAEIVPPGWIGDEAFLAGYGAAQALPGPLFTFSAYLGTLMNPGSHAWLGGVWCLLAVFLPGWLLIGGALPFWDLLRSRRWTQAALKGTNAAVVGVLLAAFYDPVFREGVHSLVDAAAALVAFWLLQFRRTPPWLVVALMAAAGVAIEVVRTSR